MFKTGWAVKIPLRSCSIEDALEYVWQSFNISSDLFICFSLKKKKLKPLFTLLHCVDWPGKSSRFPLVSQALYQVTYSKTQPFSLTKLVSTDLRVWVCFDLYSICWPILVSFGYRTHISSNWDQSDATSHPNQQMGRALWCCSVPRREWMPAQWLCDLGPVTSLDPDLLEDVV